MPVYTYRGTNRAGSSVSGELMAPNKGELQEPLAAPANHRDQDEREGPGNKSPTFGAESTPKSWRSLRGNFR
jgi:hypothetical protein